MEFWGPGIWYVIHTQALEMATEPTEFLILFRQLLLSLPCFQCTQHGLDYLTRFPPENFEQQDPETGLKVGLFIWTVNFHNAVNRRNRKPILTWKNALTIYLDPLDLGTCQECSMA